MTSQGIISPSLLSCDFLAIREEIAKFDHAKNLWFHLDIMDGHFVPNLTFGHPIIKQLGQISHHPLDAHLMVTNPDFYIETLKDCNLHNLTFHYEGVYHHDRLIQKIQQSYHSAGISFNPSTDPSVLSPYIYEKLDLVLVMSVNPGFGGQQFIEGVYQKIAWLHQLRQQKGFKFKIQVDGGVGPENAEKLILSGADNLVAGSAIFKTKEANYMHAIDKLNYFKSK